MTYPGQETAKVAYTVQWAKLLTLMELARAFQNRYPEGSFGWLLEQNNVDILTRTESQARAMIEDSGFNIDDINAEAITLREELSLHGVLCRSSLPDDAKADVAARAGLPPCVRLDSGTEEHRQKVESGG